MLPIVEARCVAVSALDFRSIKRIGGSRPGLGRHVVSLDKKHHSTFSLSTQVFNEYWKQNAVCNLRWTSIPSRGE